MFGKEFQRKYALTEQGVYNTKMGTIWTVIVNLVVMGGMGILYLMRTVEAADKIVVLKEGRVAEEGSPAELFSKEDSIFRHMTQLQNASAGWSI